MDDIEDISPVAPLSNDTSSDAANTGFFVSSDRALVFPHQSAESRHQLDVEEFTASVPGTQSVWIKTQGCSHNFSDSEYMAGILSNCKIPNIRTLFFTLLLCHIC